MSYSYLDFEPSQKVHNWRERLKRDKHRERADEAKEKFKSKRRIDARHTPEHSEVLPFQDLIDEERREREQTFFESFEEVGLIVPPEKFRHSDKGDSQLELMGHRVAQRLERLRRPGYHTGEDVYFAGANSQTTKLVPPFWRSNANPYVQRQKRRKIYKTLALYMQDQIDAGARFFMWVLHDGPRCHAMHLPRRWSAQAKKVTDWNESDFAKRNDVQVIFRSAEAGSPVQKEHKKTLNPETGKKERKYILDEAGKRIRVTDPEGRQTWHPHTHLIVRYGKRFKTKEEFREVTMRAQAHFGVKRINSDDPMTDPSEACKYVLKCDELDDVKDIDFLRFLKWTYKRRLVAFYGNAKKLKAEHERDGIRIKAQWDGKTGETKYVAKKSHHVEVVKKDMEKPWKPPYHGDKCVLVAKLEPLAYFSPIKEPMLLVRGRVDWQELNKRRDVQEILIQSQDAYDAALDAFPLIYGCTIEEFLNGYPARTETAARADLGFDFSEFRAVSLGSAHTPPVISRNSLPASQPPQAYRGKCEQSEAPKGPPTAVLSSQTTLQVGAEPPGAVNRSQKTELVGSCPQLSPDEPPTNPFDDSEYFGT